MPPLQNPRYATSSKPPKLVLQVYASRNRLARQAWDKQQLLQQQQQRQQQQQQAEQ